MRNKKVVFAGSLLLFCFVIGTIMGIIYARKTFVAPEVTEIKEEESVISNVSIIRSTPVPLATPKPSEKPELSFFICLSDGEINIYEMMEDGSMHFLDKTDIQIEQLRQEDYEKLCKGIIVNSLAEAKALTEDFGS